MSGNRAKYQGFKITVLASALILAGCAGGNKEQLHSVNWAAKQPVDLSEMSDFYAAGKKYFTQGKYGLALEQFDAELKNNRSSIKAMNGIAACYDKMGRYHVAMRYYDMALRIAPDSSLTLNNLGYSLLLQGKSSRAEKMLALAQKRDPNNIFARNNSEQLAAVKQQDVKQIIIRQPAVAQSVKENPAKKTKIQAAPLSESRIAKTTASPMPAPKVVVNAEQLEKHTVSHTAQQKPESDEGPAPFSKIKSIAVADIELKRESVIELEAAVAETSAVEIEEGRELPIIEQQPGHPITKQQVVAGSKQTSSIVTMALPDASSPVEEHANQIDVDAAPIETIAAQAPDRIAHLTNYSDSTDVKEESDKITHGNSMGAKVADIELPAAQDENAAFMHGPTQAGNSLWRIAVNLSAQRGVGVKQMVTALGVSNPEAFVDGDVNRMKVGFMLWVPTNEEIIAINMPTESMPIEKDLFAFSLEVSNGNGKRGMAKLMSIYLEEHGAQIARVNDAKSFAVKESTIYYMPGYRKEAQRLAKRLPVAAKIEEAAEQVGVASVRLVVGRDLLRQELVIRRSLISRSHV